MADRGPASADNRRPPPDRLPRTDPDWGWEFRLEDFVIARLADERGAAERLADPGERAAALARNDALRLLTALHTIYVQQDGRNWFRCYSCDSSHGVPCSTLRNLAMLWAAHPDVPDWLELSPRHFEDLVAAGSWRRLNWPPHRGQGPPLMGGRNYNLRMDEPGWGRAAFLDAAGVALRGATSDPFRTVLPCTCQHPAGAHERNVGCLHGWADADECPDITGCLCVGSPPGCRP